MDLEKKFDEATYVHSYLDTLEEVGLKVSKHFSKLQLTQWHHLDLLDGLDTAMEQLLDGSDGTQGDLNLNNLDETKKKAIKDLEQLLVSALQIGDDGLETSQKVEDLLEEELTLLNEAGAELEEVAVAAPAPSPSPSPVKSVPTTSSEEEDAYEDDDNVEYCLCEQGSSGRMIECDNHLCPIEWFHFGCVSLKKTPKGDWYCPFCRGDKKGTKMRPMTQFCKALAEYNKEKEKKAK